MSAHNCFEPVLGYSLSENFSSIGGPEALYSFLEGYKEEMRTALIDHVQPSPSLLSKWENLSDVTPQHTRYGTPVVGPLLTTTWNQGCYYNKMCPVDSSGPCEHVYAGCVATAMAQILRYWQYPSQGIGSHTYECSYGTLTADFGATTYNYDNMPNSIGYYSSTSQINEVAQLLYHCGVSVEMRYGPNGSGSALFMVVSALIDHFGYSGCHEDYKFAYTDSAWINKLKFSLDNQEPVPYSGDGIGSHAFVCDGYDSENYFHFNWGWGGNWDNYFLLSALTPGMHDYSSNQSAIFDINANTPFIRDDLHSYFFLVEHGMVSESVPIHILANALTAPLTATTTGSFQISADSVNYSSTLPLNSNGGTLYVRFAPSDSISVEHGFLYLTAGSIVDTIILTGGAYNISCAPPENLMVSSQDLQHITIHWDSAVPDHYQQILSLGVNDLDYLANISNYDSYTFMNRYCDTDLVAYHGKSLISIDFYVISGATSYTAVVYKGGSLNGSTLDPGVQVLSQTIDIGTLTADSWNTVVLNTPIEIDAAQELWFGICVEAPSNSWVIPLSSCYAPGKGNVYNVGSSFYWGKNLYNNYSFCLKGTVADRHPLIHYEVFRNGTSIGTTNELSFQDSVDEHNTLSYAVVANWSNGCSASVQRYFSNVAHIGTEPESLDFYTHYGFDNKVKSMVVVGNGLTSIINATVSDHFLISTDSLQFGSNASLDMQGGILYVKYIPDSANTPFETGVIHFQSGNVTANLPLTGQCYDACSPPNNLTLSQIDTHIVSLNWEAPEWSDPGQYELTWCLNLRSGYGYGSMMKMYMMQRFEPSDLSNYHNKFLKAISFTPNSQVTVYKILVYKGGSYNGSSYNPGTLVLEQNVDISTLTGNLWDTISLNNPITINANEELWFGLYMEAPGGSYPIKVGIPYIPHKGCITKYIAPYQSDWIEFNTTHSYSLKAIVEDVPITCTHYQIDRNEEWINTTPNTHYSDFLSTDNLYHYTVWSVWDNGCKASTRGSILVSGLCTQVGTSTSVVVCEKYQWHGTTYHNSGTYYYTSFDNGCTRVDTLHLTISPSFHENLQVSACNAYEWNGVTYSLSGDYNQTFTAVNGCDSVVTLHLTINNPVHTSVSETACESFTWNGETYTQSGTYTYSHTDANGCMQVDTLHLTIDSAYHTNLLVSACGSFTWYGETHTASGDYMQTLTAANGCDSVVILHLTINNPVHTSVTETACENYTWNGEFFTQSGIYTHSHIDANGCTQVDTLHLTINNLVNTSVTVTACERYIWNGETFTQSGIYTHSHIDTNGCTQVDTLHLTINNPVNTSVTVTACESYIWNGETFTQSGDYTHSHIDANGCTQVDTLHLTINNPVHTSVTVTACESHIWNGEFFTQSGTYTYSHIDANGCTQVDTLHLTINNPVHTSVTVTACESYIWNGETFTQSGIYTYSHIDANGCTQVDTLHLTINNPVHTSVTETACENYTWNGETFSQSGIYTHSHIDANGCTQVDTLNLTVNYPNTGDTTAVACDSFTWYGNTYTESGDYTSYGTNAEGCDSVVTLHLTIADSPVLQAISGEAEVCQNQFETYRYDISDPNYQYRWLKDNILWAENVPMVTLHETNNGIVQLTMLVTDVLFGCTADTSLLVQVVNRIAPDTTEIRRKVNSNILICKPVYSDYGTIHYRWGYTDLLTSDETMMSGDHNYCLYDFGIDTLSYLYWVETYLSEAVGNGCNNRSYYGQGIETATIEYEGNTVEAFMSNNNIVLYVNAFSPECIIATLFDVNGKLMLTRDYGAADMVSDVIPVSLAPGVYFMKVSVGGRLYSFKLLKI